MLAQIFVKIWTGGVPIEMSVLSARPLIFTLHFELDKNGRTINQEWTRMDKNGRQINHPANYLDPVDLRLLFSLHFEKKMDKY